MKMPESQWGLCTGMCVAVGVTRAGFSTGWLLSGMWPQLSEDRLSPQMKSCERRQEQWFKDSAGHLKHQEN